MAMLDALAKPSTTDLDNISESVNPQTIPLIRFRILDMFRRYAHVFDDQGTRQMINVEEKKMYVSSLECVLFHATDRYTRLEEKQIADEGGISVTERHLILAKGKNQKSGTTVASMSNATKEDPPSRYFDFYLAMGHTLILDEQPCTAFQSLVTSAHRSS